MYKNFLKFFFVGWDWIASAIGGGAIVSVSKSQIKNGGKNR